MSRQPQPMIVLSVRLDAQTLLALTYFYRAQNRLPRTVNQLVSQALTDFENVLLASEIIKPADLPLTLVIDHLQALYGSTIANRRSMPAIVKGLRLETIQEPMQQNQRAIEIANLLENKVLDLKRSEL